MRIIRKICTELIGVLGCLSFIFVIGSFGAYDAGTISIAQTLWQALVGMLGFCGCWFAAAFCL